MVERATPNVGQRIRTIREQRGWPLRVLAERSGLSINAISLIERGENSPTVASLHLLATALDVPITDFFQADQGQSVVFASPDSRMRSTANGITLESLALGLRHQRIEPFLLTLDPGAGSIDEPISHPGEEFVYCLEGSVEYVVDNQIFKLAPGYSLLFKASQPHCFHNLADRPARLIMVFLAGDLGHLARRLHLDASAGIAAEAEDPADRGSLPSP